MAGKHRGPPTKNFHVRLTRTTLQREPDRTLVYLAKKERRSLANMVSVLVEEALAARLKRKEH